MSVLRCSCCCCCSFCCCCCRRWLLSAWASFCLLSYFKYAWESAFFCYFLCLHFNNFNSFGCESFDCSFFFTFVFCVFSSVLFLYLSYSCMSICLSLSLSESFVWFVFCTKNDPFCIQHYRKAQTDESLSLWLCRSLPWLKTFKKRALHIYRKTQSERERETRLLNAYSQMDCIEARYAISGRRNYLLRTPICM